MKKISVFITEKTKKAVNAADVWIIRCLRFIFGIAGGRDPAGEQVREDLKLINSVKSRPEDAEEYCAKKIRRSLACLLLGGIAAAVTAAGSSGAQKELTDLRILRNEAGTGSRIVTLLASQTWWEEPEKITLTVKERKYSEDEFLRIVEEHEGEWEDAVLKENSSWEEITSPLALSSSFLTYPFRVRWMSSEPEIISPSGTVSFDQVEKEASAALYASISYGSFETERSFTAVVKQKTFSREEQAKADLLKAVSRAQEDSETDQNVMLPSGVGGEPVVWRRWTQNYVPVVLLLGVVLAVGVFYGSDERLKNEAKRRREQMTLDYPELLNQLALFLGAGCTLRGSWERIAFGTKKDSKRYLYEEMRYTCYEMEGGVPERTAYQHFGSRLQNPLYTKLSGLLVQNLRKGTKGLADLLSAEAREAFEIRKTNAKIRGEKAGTKLLLPMMIQLLVVLMIVVVPAFVSMQI